MKTHEKFERLLNTIVMRTGGRSLYNRLRYGPDAPRPQTQLWIDPKRIKQRYHAAANGNTRMPHWKSGKIVGGDWDVKRRPFGAAMKFRACKRRFIGGKEWEETRVLRYGMKQIARKGKYDNCTSEADLRKRYADLDDLFLKTQKARALPPSTDVEADARTGILVMVARNGDLIFANQGFHRLAIARLAKIPRIAVFIGAVHPDAVTSGAYKQIISDDLSAR